MDRAAVVILSAQRTPIGRYLGGLSTVKAVDLGVVAARAAIGASGFDARRIDEAIVGNVLSSGLGQNPARQVALGAGVPSSASALTVNMVCGSGLRAVMLADQAIRAGDAGVVLAGGIESMSNAPYLLGGVREGWKFGDQTVVDSMLSDGLTCAIEHWPMGMAAERTAELCKLTREDLDDWSVMSHRRAVLAIQAGAFSDEVVPVEVPGKKGSTTIRQDEGPRGETSSEALARLKPAFRDTGIVTAGNSSMLSDGAAMLVVASGREAEATGATPLGQILAIAVAGREPRDLFLAPIDAVRSAVAKAGIPLDEVDLFEINEAFGSQVVGCVRELGIDPEKVNVNGGAIALGHPIGASGARVLVTLLHALRIRKARIGVAAVCLGGGNAVAMVVQRP